MRRIVGLVLVGLGVMLIILAIALPTYVYPRVAKAPDNPDQHITAVGTGLTVLVPASVVKGGNGIFTDQKVQVTRNVIGVKPPKGQLPDDQAFYQLAFEARVIDNPQLKDDEGLLQAYVEGASFDGDTGEATNCCGDYLRTQQEDTNQAQVTHHGVLFKFPFNTKRQDYPFWDANTRQASPARYDGTDRIEGLQTYRFVQTITDTTIATQQVPGALLGLDEQTVNADRVYATTRTLWVEPRTGAIIKGQEKVDQRLLYKGKEIPVINGTLAYDDATVKANVDKYGGSARSLAFVSRTGPIGGWILGPILILIGLTMLALSRRQEVDEWDDWNDEYDDDDAPGDASGDDAGFARTAHPEEGPPADAEESEPLAAAEPVAETKVSPPPKNAGR